MASFKEHRERHSGFALLVVLSTLAILTLLFAVSTRLSLAHIQGQGTERHLAEKSALRNELLTRMTHQFGALAEAGQFTISMSDEDYLIQVVNAGGLIDLNTANPRLLDAYLEGIGLKNENIKKFRDWRQSSKRLLRITDLQRVSGATDIDFATLRQTATVVSGRSGISPSDAPEMLTDLLASSWRDEWASAASSSNFEVFLLGGRADHRIGAFHLSGDGSVRSIWID